ncbi:tetratricopeptide repeat protein [Galbibacter mesophilus]|uniref:hypothetical protein n=1 Tax=Galbibacter mesophilus TaxID=379069 RepID=UPI00191F1292|nr:hypothetical protein [Galbibacter mesophilus]MCM5663891.1 hypothetical protein [Galbibacter mesophilus]
MKLGRNKILIFKILTVLLSVVFIIFVEYCLRWFEYGNDYSLFTSVKEQPGFIRMNPKISEKYFSSKENARTGFHEVFKEKKEGNTFRIFVLGASTGVGYPYINNGSFHRWLQFALNETYTSKQIEIINLSITAVNSYTLRDFSEKILPYQPDAVLIYAGHNEYYGTLGVGSVNSLSGHPRLAYFVLNLRELRSFQLLFNGYVSLREMLQGKQDFSETLMKRMVKDQEIPLDSELYNDGIYQFQYNLDKILGVFNENNIATFISTVVSNEKDLQPFISSRENNESSAIEHYKKAKEAYIGKNYGLAKKEFILAKELDLLRFRAPEAFNEIIKDKSKEYEQVTLVETYREFESYSPHSIIGSELMLEHVHPNLKGYSILGYSFYKSIFNSKLVSNKYERFLDYDVLWNEMPITIVDSLQGAYETMMLKEGWPFYQPIEDYPDTEKSVPETIAGKLSVKQISWEEAMNDLYEHYYNKRDYKNAIKVCQAVILQYPNNSAFYLKAAGLAMDLNDVNLARKLFDKALRIKPSIELEKKIAINFIKMEAFEASLVYIDRVLTKDSSNNLFKNLKTAINSIVRYNGIPASELDIEKNLSIAKSFLLIGKKESAVIYIDEVLNIQPNNASAISLKSKIEQ